MVDAHPEITRLYTTLSADEMTLDPLFAFNADLPAVDNQHTAVRVIECNPDVFQSEAPFRIELPQGGVVRGTAADAQSRVWPKALEMQPPNRLIVQSGETGPGKVLEDNSNAIDDLLAGYNAAVPALGSNPGGAPSTGAAGAENGGTSGPSTSGGAATSQGDKAVPATSVSGGGCSVSAAGSPLSAWVLAAALGTILGRRRRLGHARVGVQRLR